MSDATEADPDGKGLGKRTTRGLGWNLIGNIGANGLRVAVIPILGRLLTPAEFGYVAAALTVYALAAFLKDGGVGTSLVQRKQLTQKHIESAFSFSVLFGLAIAAVLYLSAPWVARFYGLPELTALVEALAVMFVLRGVSIVPQALARRDMQFKALALIDLVSYFLGAVASVVLAFLGYGAWSLIVGYLIETVTSTLALLALRRVRYRLVPERAALSDLLGYGAGHTVGEIAAYFAYQGDNMVVGNQLGAGPLGLYTRAYDLMRYPSVVFSNVAGVVLFSAFSKIQDDPERLGRVYRRAVFGTSVVLFPVSVALLLLAPELVLLLLGPDWSSAILPFQILAISMLPRTTFKIGATIARASGDVVAVGGANVLYGLMVIGGAMLVVGRWGIEGVAVSTTIALLINFIILSHLGLRRTQLSWGGFGAAHVWPLLTGAMVGGAVWPLARLLRATDAPSWLVIVVPSILGLCAGVVALAIGVMRRQSDWVWLYTGLRTRLRFLPAVS